MSNTTNPAKLIQTPSEVMNEMMCELENIRNLLSSSNATDKDIHEALTNLYVYQVDVRVRSDIQHMVMDGKELVHDVINHNHSNADLVSYLSEVIEVLRLASSTL